MTLNNVAVVMAPNIFMCKGFRNKIREQEEFAMATGTANIVRLLIRYQNLLWTVRDIIQNQNEGNPDQSTQTRLVSVSDPQVRSESGAQAEHGEPAQDEPRQSG